MRILLVSPRYYPYIGGVEYVARALAERLSKKGNNVTVVAGEPRAARVSEDIVNGVRVVRWPVIALGGAYYVPRNTGRFISVLVREAKSADVVHVHSAHAVLPVYAGLKVKEMLPSIRLVFTLHYHARGHTLLRDLLWKTVWRRYVGRLIGQADVIQAVSIVEAERILFHYPEASNKIVVVPNGVEEDVLSYQARGTRGDYAIYSGRIEKYKRLDTAIEVAEKLGIRIIVVGRGTYRQKLVAYAERKYPGRALFMPPLPRDKYLELLSRAKMAINLSHDEAFSIFIAEALALGTPALVSSTIKRALGAKPTSTFEHRGEVFFLVTRAPILVWSSVVDILLEKIYNT